MLLFVVRFDGYLSGAENFPREFVPWAIHVHDVAWGLFAVGAHDDFVAFRVDCITGGWFDSVDILVLEDSVEGCEGCVNTIADVYVVVLGKRPNEVIPDIEEAFDEVFSSAFPDVVFALLDAFFIILEVSAFTFEARFDFVDLVVPLSKFTFEIVNAGPERGDFNGEGFVEAGDLRDEFIDAVGVFSRPVLDIGVRVSHMRVSPVDGDKRSTSTYCLPMYPPLEGLLIGCVAVDYVLGSSPLSFETGKFVGESLSRWWER